jgi:hypothetical protein
MDLQGQYKYKQTTKNGTDSFPIKTYHTLSHTITHYHKHELTA